MNLRLPEEIDRRLEEVAAENQRTKTAEIIVALKRYFAEIDAHRLRSKLNPRDRER